MNRNLKQSIWVLAIGMAFTGLSAAGSSAAVPAQQGQDQNWNHDQDHNDNQRGARWYFQQGLQDGQHDRQYGGNRSDHRQPRDSNDLSAYRDGYKHGYRNIPVSQRSEQNRTMDYFDQGLRDGQHDRQYGGNRTDHQQPNSGDAQTAYRDGYKHGFRNIPVDQPTQQYVNVNYFELGLRDGQSDRQTGASRSDHQQPNDPNDLRAYRDGYNQGFRNISVDQPTQQYVNVNYFELGLRDGQSDRQTGASRSDHQQPNDPNDLRAYRDGYKQGFRDTGGRNN